VARPALREPLLRPLLLELRPGGFWERQVRPRRHRLRQSRLILPAQL
jgi:hypothetical protein